MTTEIDNDIAEEKDIDTLLAETWADIQNRGEEAQANAETDEQKTERQRDESGEFAKRDKPEGEEQLNAEQGEQKPEEQAPAVEAPSSLRKEFQEKFKELPAEWQAEIKRREDDFFNGISQYKQAAEYAQAFTPIAEHLNYLKSTYGDHVQPIGELAKLDRFANTDPVGFIKWFAQSRGIPLDGTGVQDMQSNPVLTALQQQFQQLSSYVQNERQTREQQAHQEAIQAIEAFRNSPEAVHFEELRPQIQRILANGLADDLKSAHEMALWSRPDLRESLITQQLEAKQEKAKQEAMQRAEAAKKAASVNVNKRGHLPAKVDEDPDEVIQRKAAELGFI